MCKIKDGFVLNHQTVYYMFNRFIFHSTVFGRQICVILVFLHFGDWMGGRYSSTKCLRVELQDFLVIQYLQEDYSHTME